MSTVEAGAQPANPTRASYLDDDFDHIITADQYAEFRNDRWPGLKMAIPIATFFATLDRATLLEKARGLGETIVNDEGEDGLKVALQTVESVKDFCAATAEIMDTLITRLLLVADDLLIESGQPSAIAQYLSEQSAEGEA